MSSSSVSKFKSSPRQFLPAGIQGEFFVHLLHGPDEENSPAGNETASEEFKVVVGFAAVAATAGDHKIWFVIQAAGGEWDDVIEGRIFTGHRPGAIKAEWVAIDQAMMDCLPSTVAALLQRLNTRTSNGYDFQGRGICQSARNCQVIDRPLPVDPGGSHSAWERAFFDALRRVG